jgi:hypothetical protein
MKILFLLNLLFFISCSGGGSSDAEVVAGLSVTQKQAQALIRNDIQPLQNEQYGISDRDLAALQNEGLITQEELNSLNVVK